LWNCSGKQSYWIECKESVIRQGAVCGFVEDCIATGQIVRGEKKHKEQFVEL
jgi:hypothetical protein